MVPIEGQEPVTGPLGGSTVGQALSSSLAINLKTEDTTGPSGLLKGQGGVTELIGDGGGADPGVRRTYTLAPQRPAHPMPCLAPPSPAPPPRPRSLELSQETSLVSSLLSPHEEAPHHWDEAWDHHPPSLLGEEVGTSQGPVSSLGPLCSSSSPEARPSLGRGAAGPTPDQPQGQSALRSATLMDPPGAAGDQTALCLASVCQPAVCPA